jgi:hypothetical protein
MKESPNDELYNRPLYLPLINICKYRVEVQPSKPIFICKHVLVVDSTCCCFDLVITCTVHSFV